MRRTSDERVGAIWGAVTAEPGLRPGQVADRLGLDRSAVSRALPALEEAGLLLSEDGRGRLWPFAARQRAWRRR